MKKPFVIGQTALDVSQTIVNNNPQIDRVTIIAHRVGYNWRSIYDKSSTRLEKMLDGFEHSPPQEQREYPRKRFQQLTMEQVYDQKDHGVWSMTSRVKCFDGVPDIYL